MNASSRRSWFLSALFLGASLASVGVSACNDSPPATDADQKRGDDDSDDSDDDEKPKAKAKPDGGTTKPALDVTAKLEELRVANDLPALGGAIVTHEGVFALGVTGVRKYGDDTKAATTDPFHLGSDTKAFAATVLAKLVEQKKLGWKTTLAEVFPDQVATMDTAYKSVTLAQLLAMRGGFPASSVPMGETLASLRAYTGAPRAQREKYVAKALATPPQNTPGSAFLYSNMSYVVAMAMGEKIADAAWEDLLASIILSPLGITGAGHGAMGSPGALDAPWQHHREGATTIPVAPGPNADNPIALDPAGRVHMPLQGWSLFVRDQLGGAQGTAGVLTPEGYAALQTPLFGGDYVGGWVVTEREWAKGKVLTHAGSNTQNYAVVWAAPEADVAFLVVTNIASDDDSVATACDEAIGALLGIWQAR